MCAAIGPAVAEAFCGAADGARVRKVSFEGDSNAAAAMAGAMAAACEEEDDVVDEGFETVPPEKWEDELCDLAEARSGGAVQFATDEWFAVASNMLKTSAPAFDPNAFCTQGKVMDGWETRRKRTPGHDWCVIKLGMAGCVHGVEVDTAHFTGNQVPACSVWAASLDEADGEWLPAEFARGDLGEQGTCSTQAQIQAADEALHKAGEWCELVALERLRPGYVGDSVHRFRVPPAMASKRMTHLRLNSYPDGGIARLRVWGTPVAHFEKEIAAVGVANLASAALGARGVACSNKHYGVPRNLLREGRGVNMGDGWETARNPHRPLIFGPGGKAKSFTAPKSLKRIPAPPGMPRSASAPALMSKRLDLTAARAEANEQMACDSIAEEEEEYCASDWCVLRLAAVADGAEELHLDTAHFRGNYPESASVEAIYSPHASTEDILSGDAEWRTLLERTPLKPDTNHTFTRAEGQLLDVGKISHVRLHIFPDGGIMRLRLYSRACEPMPTKARSLRKSETASRVESSMPRSASAHHELCDHFEASAKVIEATASASPSLLVRPAGGRVGHAMSADEVTGAFLSGTP